MERKERPVTIRYTEPGARELKLTAKLLGLTVSELIRRATRREAERVLEASEEREAVGA